MQEKVLIKTNTDSNLLDALIYYMDAERIDYVISNELNEYS